MRGETTTGITTFQMDEGMDTGAMLLMQPTPIGEDETAGELATRLSHIGAEVIVETLDRLDTLEPMPQPHDEATLAPRLKKSDGHLDWRRSARELVNQVRGTNPWPGAVTATPRGTLTIWRASLGSIGASASAGTLVKHDGGLAVSTGDGLLVPIEVQPENRRAMSWVSWLSGARLEPGAQLV